MFRNEELDARADVYSLGCVLYECLTGAVPFPGTTDAAVMYSHLQDAPPSISLERPELPPAIDDVVHRAMAKRHEDRYATCGDLVRAVRDALSPAEPVVVPIGDAPSLRPSAPTHRFGASRDAPDTLVAHPPPMRVVPVTTRPERRSDPKPGPGRPRRARRWDRRRVIAFVVAVAMFGAAAASGIAVMRGHPSPPPLVLRTPVVATIPVGSRPLAIAFGDDSAWAVDSGDGTVSRIDPATNDVVATIAVGTDPQGVAIGAGALWVANAGDDTISQIDTASNRVVATIDVGGTPEGVAFGEGSVWVANAASNSASTIDPETGRVIDTIDVGRGPVAVTVAGGSVWVVSVGDNSVFRVNPRRDRVVGTIPIPAGANSIAFGGGELWVGNDGARHGFVSRISTGSDAVITTIDVGPSPFGLTFADGSLWVAQVFDGTVTRIDPATNSVTSTIPVGNGPAGIAFGAGDLWVTKGDGTVARIRP